jgi:hypothetical protein
VIALNAGMREWRWLRRCAAARFFAGARMSRRRARVRVPKQIREDFARWGKVVNLSGAKVD